MFGLVLSNISAFILCVMLIVILRRVSIAFSLVDHPDARKRHEGTIPLCGGIAVFSSFALITAISGEVSGFGINYWIGTAVIVMIGIADDRYHLSAKMRFLVELAIAAVLLVALNISNLVVSICLTSLPLAPLVALIIALFFIVGLVNSWNMLDGVDGLAGGSAALAFIWLMLVAAHADTMGVVTSLEMLLVTLCGFLIFNMRSPWRVRAGIFLGDAGSTALGATIAYVVLVLAAGKPAVPFASLLWIVIVPVLDTLSLMVRRMLASRSPMSADRWHLHHLLMDSGLSPGTTTALIIGASMVCGGIGYLGILCQVPGPLMAVALIVPAGLHTVFVFLAQTQHPAWQRLMEGRRQPKPKEVPLVVTSSEREFGNKLVRDKTSIEF
jgi:UDP-GlcNAc:undecaprenyl-phosphate GlcNAc-1-phosphate transferase